jgi:hypothetical protein
MTCDEDKEVMVTAKVIEDLLFLVAPSKRIEVLKKVVANEEAACRKRHESGGLEVWTIADLPETQASPGWRYWNSVMRFKSLIIQVFLRNITSNHSREDAAKILFMGHSNGTGSGWLPDYLDGLPAIKVDLEKAAAIADLK